MSGPGLLRFSVRHKSRPRLEPASPGERQFSFRRAISHPLRGPDKPAAAVEGPRVTCLAKWSPAAEHQEDRRRAGNEPLRRRSI